MVQAGAAPLDLRPYPSRRLPEHIVAAVTEAARAQINSPSRGSAEFCVAVAATLNAELGIALDPEAHILATSGGMHALFLIFMALLDAGDEVLTPAPCYFLEGMIETLGANIVYVPMDEGRQYAWDMDRLESRITSRTKCIFVNSPANPTGYVLNAADVARLADIAERHGLLLIADESYNRLVFDGKPHLSVAAVPGAMERTLLVRSFTKSFAMPGWRVGFVAGPAPLIALITKALEWNMLYGSHVTQAAATAALQGPQDWLDGVAEEFQRSRDLIVPRVRGIDGLAAVMPRGGPFLLLDISRVDCEEEEFAGLLLNEFRIPTTPGRYFRAPGHLRMAFGATNEVLAEVGVRLERAVAMIGAGRTR